MPATQQRRVVCCDQDRHAACSAVRWVAIEGPCCAGKTTLGHGLLEQLDPGSVTIVTDYADFVGGAAGMPDPDPPSWFGERSAIDVLLELETARLKACLPKVPPPLVLIDRSVLTIEAHCAGLDRRHRRRPPFLGRTRRLLAEDPRPCWPQAVLYLDPPHEVQLARNDGKFAAGSIFMDATYNAGFREHFARSRQDLAGRLEWIDADQPVAAIVAHALEFLAESDVAAGDRQR